MENSTQRSKGRKGKYLAEETGVLCTSAVNTIIENSGENAGCKPK
jgi:hypothetical protein